MISIERSNEKIKKENVDKVYNLTPMQEGMLFHTIVNPHSGVYYQQISLIIKGNLEVDILEKSFNLVIDQYDVLRTNFIYQNVKKPQQIVYKERSLNIEYSELTGSKEDKKNFIQNYLKQERLTGFNLLRDSLIKITCFKTDINSYNLIISNHHIVLDGWSMGIITKHVLEYYHSLIKGKAVSVQKSSNQFNVFVKWQNRNNKEESLKYWETYLDGYDSIKNFPETYTPIDKDAYEYCIYKFRLKEGLACSLKKIAAENKMTLSSLIQVMWAVILQKYNNTEDVVFGNIISGRVPEIRNIEDMAGLFINIVPVRVTCSKNDTFRSLLTRVYQQTLESNYHSHCSLAEIQSRLGYSRELFGNILEFENYPLEKTFTDSNPEIPYQVEDVSLHLQSNYNFNMSIVAADQIDFTIRYNGLAYDESMMINLEKQMEFIAGQIISNPDILVRDMILATKEERRHRLQDYNNTSTDYPRDKTLQKLFEEIAVKYPDRIALKSGEMELSYSSLNSRANVLALKLREQGLKSGGRAALLLERSPDMIVSILAVLKCAAAYIPIETSNPPVRITSIIQNSRPDVLIIHESLEELIEDEVRSRMLILESLHIWEEEIPCENMKSEASAEDTAYIIYTSGTTGAPKGNLISHKNVSRVVKNTNYIEITPQDRLLQISTYAFDGSVFDIFGALLNGAALILISRNHLLDMKQLSSLIYKERITIFFITTALFNAMAESKDFNFEYVRTILFGGERVSRHHVETMLGNVGNNKLIHVYGPTESTVFSTYYKVNALDKKSNTVPIGKPLANTSVFILDKNFQIQAMGGIGEIYIGGEGLAKGYLNEKEQTEEKFLTLPYIFEGKLYKTGDLAKWLPSGEIEYIGRIDNQVKLRGFRIELGEIESGLLKHPMIKNAVVLCEEGEQRKKELKAYIVLKEPITADSIREFLSGEIPEYMIPSVFIQLDHMDLNANGKIDKKSLSNGIILKGGSNYIPPEGYVEQTLCMIWEDVLGSQSVGVTDNYFSHGGDSIKAIQIASRLRNFNMSVEISSIFKYPTIRSLSLHITQIQESADISPIEGTVLLSPIQQWFFETYESNTAHFNQSVLLKGIKRFDETILRKVFTSILKHHDALRMTYTKSGEQIIQYNENLTSVSADFEVIDKQESDISATDFTLLCQEIQETLDPIDKQLVKFRLIRTKEEDVLFFVIHHLIVDAVSWRILLEDFYIGYQQALEGKPVTLQAKTMSYKEWVSKLKDYSCNKKVLSQIDYWNNILSKAETSLPCDSAVSDNRVKKSAMKTLVLSADETSNLLRKVHFAYHTEINDILISVLAITINQWCKSRHVTINMEGHGRNPFQEDINVNRTVGWFTSMFPVVIDIDKNDLISDVIVNVKEELNRIPEDGMFYQVLRYLSDSVDGHELLKVKPQGISFNYLGQFDQDLNTDLFQLSDYDTGESVNGENKRNYMLDMNAYVKNGQFVLDISYAKEQYKEESMDKLLGLFTHSFRQVIGYCINQRVSLHTPSDYTNKTLSAKTVKELNQLYAAYGIEDIYKLTPMQEGMLYNAISRENSKAYLEEVSFTVKRKIEIKQLEKSLKEVLKRHDILRAVINYKTADKPLQVILNDRDITIHYVDLCSLPLDEKETYIKEYQMQQCEKGFNLTSDLLIRLGVFKVAPDAYRFVFHFHHIIMDGWCLGIVIGELFELYHLFEDNSTQQLKGTVPFRTYLDWLDKQNAEEGENYWREYMEGFYEASVIPRSGRQDESMVERFGEFAINLGSELSREILHFASMHNVTVNTLFRAAWGVVLAYYNCSQDVVFGAVVSGRHYKLQGVDTMIGLCINTIPVRVKADRNKAFIALLAQLQQDSLDSERYDFYPLAKLQGMTAIGQNLFDHLMVFENYPLDKTLLQEDNALQEFILSDIEVREQTNYDFTITIVPGEEIQIRFSYNENAFLSERVKKIAGHFKQCLTTVLTKEDVRIEEIDILTLAEKEEILYQFNNTSYLYPQSKLLHQLFEEQVERTPEKTAVIFKSSHMSYRIMNEKANQLARFLRKKGVKEDTVVAVLLDRSFDMMVGLMSVLKAGGAYLPVGINTPLERVNKILKSSTCSLMLTRTDMSGIDDYAVTKVFMDEREVNFEEKDNLSYINTPENLAYVIYTSGSTGEPKGVMIEHRAVINRLLWGQKQYSMGESDVILQKTPYTFDVSVCELFWWTAAGGAICFLEQGEEKNPDSIIDAIYENSVTYIHFVPSMLSAFMEYLASEPDKVKKLSGLKKVFTSGEALRLNHVKTFHELLGADYHIELHNLYGPTETSIEVSYFDCTKQKDAEIIPIGKPIDNTQLYIVGNGNLQAIGVPGELMIAGICLSRGYLNNKKLTDEYFIESLRRDGSKMYKTGDLARWLPDGNIEYLGRIDNQVKIRGFRIELGEIEHQLMNFESVKDAVVVAKGMSGGDKDNKLCAYVTSASFERLDFGEIKAFLIERLPDYMIPSYFMQLDHIPLSPNGKADRKNLPEIEEMKQPSEQYLPPRNKIERILAVIWEQVLNIDQVGIKDKFFKMGGDSIKAIQIIARLNKQNLKLNVKDLFLYQTIEELSEHVLISDNKTADQGEVSGEVPLTPVQQWYFEQNFSNRNHWNQAIMFYYKNGYDAAVIERLITKLVTHHDGLRLSFILQGDHVIQYNRRSEEGKQYYFEVFDLRGVLAYEEAIKQHVNKLHEIIHIEKGPLFAAGQFITDYGDYLFIAVHHLGIDGVSLRILIDDLQEGYEQCMKGESIVFPKKTHSFKEWSIRLREYASELEKSKEADYWDSVEQVMVPELPVDYKENQNKKSLVKDSKVAVFQLSEDMTSQLLQKTGDAYNTEINDLLLSALGMTIYQWTGEQKTKVLLEGHGREEILHGIDISRTVGWFTTQYPVILDGDYGGSIKDIIRITKENIRKIPQKGIGYGILKYLCGNGRYKTLWDKEPEICFNYLGEFNKGEEGGVCVLSTLDTGDLVSIDSFQLYRLNVNAVILEHKLCVTIQYSTKIYDPDTIDKIGNQYIENITKIVWHCMETYETSEQSMLTPSDVGDMELSMEDLDYMVDFIQSL